MESKRRNGNRHLPQELVLDILLRLPVKSLSRFKCVSKNWCSLIRSPSFVKQHFERNQEHLLIRLVKKHDPEENESAMPMGVDEPVAEPEEEEPPYLEGCDDDYYDFLIAERIAEEEYYRQQMLDVERYKHAMYVDETFSEYEEPSHLQLPDECSELFGPVNGVFCVVTHLPWGPMALLNPALRQFKPLPLVERNALANTSFYDNELGFGLDPLTGDYKLVLILYFDVNLDGQDYICVASVCNSDSDSWRVLEDVDSINSKRPARTSLCSTYMKGDYYWLLEFSDTSNDVAILAFDMGTEKFREIQVTGCDAQSKQGYLAVCGDSLALLMCDQFEHVGRFIDVWIMKNEGCWIKSSRVGSLEGISRPLCFWKNNKLLLETMTSLLAQSNVSTQELKTFEAKKGDQDHFSHWVFVYKESLVSIEGEVGKCKLWDTSSDFVKDFFKL
ncbi:hypothetical protein C2S51_006130 [Perilla frutescens var. frutescens]|nr:hypothetical protein C2S51_006130 [Perilla frutescens var. frutescens]